ncbi:NlpC/P60 family protein [Anaerobranca californiensis DSM 14826]|jgi:hypothetical protein|uniref:NlpC/P60 family protein n=1 Tax=Anaerobranca californiensis DSM 14826 TaxID=1120989 RepID=A0A1M6QER1_9FIRM|nr:SH3 domain-containing protein [Anaerobranca californiensis]SHK18655.1 NlpC/P60 family protein [Anaerobranca californiensis DSM 14826]
MKKILIILLIPILVIILYLVAPKGKDNTIILEDMLEQSDDILKEAEKVELEENTPLTLIPNEKDEDYYIDLYQSLHNYYRLIPKIDENVINPLFWIKKAENPYDLLMDLDQINEFNKKNYEYCENLFDITSYSEVIDGQKLKSLINDISSVPKNTRYNNDKKYTYSDYQLLLGNLNIDKIKDINPVKYGVTVRRTQMRTFPTKQVSYSKPNNFDFDLFVETAIYPCEPLVVLHESTDKEWYFVHMYNYYGWVAKKDIAIGDKEKILQYINSNDFLMVIGRQYELNLDNETITFDMGSKIPFKSQENGQYKIIIPKRDSNGNLYLEEVLINQSDKLYLGYLPYNVANIIIQSFEFHGEPYGWGGMNNTRDCSALVMDIYRTFGIKLPRNASQQGRNSYGLFITPDNLAPGMPIYMPSHTMIYLGEYQGEHYAIHNFSGFYRNGKYQRIMATLVTPLSIKNSQGKTYYQLLYNGRLFILTE